MRMLLEMCYHLVLVSTTGGTKWRWKTWCKRDVEGTWGGGGTCGEKGVGVKKKRIDGSDDVGWGTCGEGRHVVGIA